MQTEPSDFPVNLRRLVVWHHATNREAAEAIGASEHSLSGWMTGKREPGGRYLRRIGELYEVNPMKMFGDPALFGLEIADPGRFERAQQNIERALAERART
jgi:hypothetical protein